MAETLVMDLDSDWDPAQYHDEYVEKLDQLVQAKKKAGDVQTLTGIVEDEIVPAQGADIVDLTELLRRSLRAGGKNAAGEEDNTTKRTRTAAANDAGSHHARKAAAHKSSSSASTSVKPARRKRAA
jgi:DNA end-binding protein Ku